MIKVIRNFWCDGQSAHLAFKIAAGVILTWLLTLRLGSDATSSTAMISVIIIMLTASRGASLIKAAARTAGTTLGAIYVILISGAGLTDAMLFNFYMILGIVLSISLASYYHDNTAYIFMLAGLTVAIVGFPISVNPTVFQAFDSVQARCIGIMIAIITCEILNAIIPFGEDAHRLLPIKRQTLNFMIFTLGVSDRDKVREAFSHLISVVLRNKSLPLQSLLSSRESISTIVASRDALFHCLSVSIATTKIKRLITSCDICGVGVLEAVKKGLVAIENNEVDIDILMARIHIADTNEGKIIICHIKDLYQNAMWLNSPSLVVNQTQYSHQISDFVKHSDNLAIATNALRASIVLGIVSFLWIGTGWTIGMGASLMATILLSLHVIIPEAKIGILDGMKATVICASMGFAMNFFIMPYLSPLGVFTLMFFYIYMVTYQFGHCKTANKVIFMNMLVYWSVYMPLTNVPLFDPSLFLNNLLGNLFAMCLVFLAYILIPEISENTTTKRFIRRIIKRARKTKRYDKLNSELFSSDFIVSIYPYMLSNRNDLNSLNKILFISALSKVLSCDDMIEGDEATITAWIEWLVSSRLLTTIQQTAIQERIDQRLDEYHRNGNLDGVGVWWEISILWKGLDA